MKNMSVGQDAFRPRVFGKRTSRLLHRYYHGPDHPMKLRLWWAFRRLVRYRRLTLPYATTGWITVDERDLLQGEIFTSGAYEPEVWEAVARFAVRDEVVWDVGGNIGSFSIRAIDDARVAEVHAFEPDPVSASILRTNVALNPGNSRVHPLALGAQAERRVLHRGPDANSGLSGFDNALSHAEFVVDIRTVDEMVYERGVPAPTLLKIDVEGWEAQVLEGAGRLLAEAPPKAIVFETACDRAGTIIDARLVELLRAAGYAVQRVTRPDGAIEERENYLAVHRGIGT